MAKRLLTDHQVRQLHNGDQVTWNDPDGGCCTKTVTIQTIVVGAGKNPVVSIADKAGDDLQCFASELS